MYRRRISSAAADDNICREEGFQTGYCYKRTISLGHRDIVIESRRSTVDLASRVMHRPTRRDAGARVPIHIPIHSRNGNRGTSSSATKPVTAPLRKTRRAKEVPYTTIARQILRINCRRAFELKREFTLFTLFPSTRRSRRGDEG